MVAKKQAGDVQSASTTDAVITEAETEAETVETVQPVVGKGGEEAPTPIHKMSLSKLIGGMIERAIEDPTSVTQSAHNLQIWHDAQSVEDRKQLVTETKKLIERAKLTTEYLYSQYQLISQRDL